VDERALGEANGSVASLASLSTPRAIGPSGVSSPATPLFIGGVRCRKAQDAGPPMELGQTSYARCMRSTCREVYCKPRYQWEPVLDRGHFGGNRDHHTPSPLSRPWQRASSGQPWHLKQGKICSRLTSTLTSILPLLPPPLHAPGELAQALTHDSPSLLTFSLPCHRRPGSKFSTQRRNGPFLVHFCD
jgi:hypothetical protein